MLFTKSSLLICALPLTLTQTLPRFLYPKVNLHIIRPFPPQVNLFLSARKPKRYAAFEVLDIVKIFGRLSDPHIIGHCIGHARSECHGGYRSKTNWRWHNIFSDKVSVGIKDFKNSLKSQIFCWPQTPNSGQLRGRPNVLVPVSPKVYAGYFNNLHSSKGQSRRLASVQDISALVQSEALSNDAVECVFSALTDSQTNLSWKLMEHTIDKWAPLDGLVDWHSFIYQIHEDPSDGLQNYLD